MVKDLGKGHGKLRKKAEDICRMEEEEKNERGREKSKRIKTNS